MSSAASDVYKRQPPVASANLSSEPAQCPYLILQLSQEEGQEVLNGVVFAQDGREAHDDRGQGRFDMLVGIGHQLLGGRRGSHGISGQIYSSAYEA